MTGIIRNHHDADGITAGYFAAYGYPKHKLEIWDGAFGDTTGMKKGDVMCDMRPIQNLADIIVYDHHLPHREDHKYKLISSEDMPASYITWNEFKDNIPK